MTPDASLDIGDQPFPLDAPLSPWEINRILYGRSMPKANATSNCGDAAGGFQAGNTCAKGEGSGGGNGGSDTPRPSGGDSSPSPARSPAFKAWFGDWESDPERASKIVDANGEPLVVYHGTRATFDEFDPSKGSEYGIYTTPRRKYAEAYGQGKAHALYLNIRNPLTVEYKGEISPRDLTKQDIDGLIAKGYDGIISVSDPSTPWKADEIVAFHPNQIKSATGNRGTFDPDSGRITYGRSTPLVRHPVTGHMVSARNSSGDAGCSRAASQWRTGQTSPDTFKVLAACRAKASAHKMAGNLRAAGKEGHAQVLEHRAVTGKVGAGNRKNLASKLKAERARKAAVAQHPEQPEVEASRKTGHENIGKTPDLKAAVAKHRLNKGSRSDRLDSLANQASAHHEMIALSEGANSKAYQSAIKRAIRIKRAADKERPELSPRDAAMVRKGNDERFDEAMRTQPKRVIKLKPTSELHKAAREAVGSALESRSAAEEANRVPGLDPEKKGQYFSIAEKRYREAQGPLKALRKEQGKTKASAPATPPAKPQAHPSPSPSTSSEQSPGHPTRDVPDEPTSEGLLAKGYREIGPGAARASAAEGKGSPAPSSTARPKSKGELINELIDKNHQENRAAAKGASSVVLGNDETTGFNRLIVHPSAHSKGKWQLSRISASNGEPMGHSTHETMEDAIASASGKSVKGEPPVGDRSFKVIDKRGSEAAPQATAQGVRPAPRSHAAAREGFGLVDAVASGHHEVARNLIDKAAAVIGKRDPRFAPTTASQIAGARIADIHHRQGQRLEEAANKTTDWNTPAARRLEEVYDRNAAGKRGAMSDLVQQHTGSRTLAADVDRGVNPRLPDTEARRGRGNVPGDSGSARAKALVEKLRGKAKGAATSPAVHLPTFAANVHSSAASVPPARRFGGDKAFIHDVHGEYQKAHGPISREQFNQHLLNANRAGHLELSRADMVEAMKPGDVSASDTRHPMGGTFNFVRVKGGKAEAANPPKPAPAKMSPERVPASSSAPPPKTADDRRTQIDRLVSETAAHTERLHNLKGRMLDAITRANVSEGMKSPNAKAHRIEAERAKADHAAASERLQNHLGRIEQLTHGLNANARRLDKANTVEERREGFVPGTGRAKVSKPAAKTPTPPPAIPPSAPQSPSIDWKAMVRNAEAAQRQRDAEVLKTARATGALPHGKGAIYKAARKLGDRTYAQIINADTTTHLPMYKDSSGNYTKSSVRNLARRQRELLVEKLRDSASRRQG